jgi:hypothetical protein
MLDGGSYPFLAEVDPSKALVTGRSLQEKCEQSPHDDKDHRQGKQADCSGSHSGTQSLDRASSTTPLGTNTNFWSVSHSLAPAA